MSAATITTKSRRAARGPRPGKRYSMNPFRQVARQSPQRVQLRPAAPVEIRPGERAVTADREAESAARAAPVDPHAEGGDLSQSHGDRADRAEVRAMRHASRPARGHSHDGDAAEAEDPGGDCGGRARRSEFSQRQRGADSRREGPPARIDPLYSAQDRGPRSGGPRRTGQAGPRFRSRGVVPPRRAPRARPGCRREPPPAAASGQRRCPTPRCSRSGNTTRVRLPRASRGRGWP